jgi:hypothetical protein
MKYLSNLQKNRNQMWSKVTIQILLLLSFSVFTNQLSAQTNYVLDFNGVNDYVSINDTNTNYRSIEFWFKPDNTIDANTTQDGHTFIARNDNSEFREYGLFIRGTDWTTDRGHIFFYVRDNGLLHEIKSNANTWAAGVWHHVAAVIDPVAGLQLYIDCVLQTQTDPTYTGSVQIAQEITALGRWGDSPIRYFDGRMDELRLWERAISASEICSKQCLTLNPATEFNLNKYYPMNEGSGTFINSLGTLSIQGQLLSPGFIVDQPCSNPCTLVVTTQGAGCGTPACPYQCSGTPGGGTFSGPAGLNAITGQFIGSIPPSGIPYTYTLIQGTCTYTATGLISKTNTSAPPVLSTYVGPSVSGPQLIVTWPCTGYTCGEWYQFRIQTSSGGVVPGCTTLYTSNAPSASFSPPYSPLVNTYTPGSIMPVSGTCGKVLATCTSLVAGQSYCVTWRINRCGVTGLWSTCFVTPAQRPLGEEQTLEELIQNQVYPNPATTNINVEFNLEAAGMISLQLYNMNGQKVEEKKLEAESGQHRMMLDAMAYPSGNYLLRVMQGQNQIMQEKVRIVR